MTRNEILAQFDVEGGIIRTPGKFQSEPIYAPYFWDLMMDGVQDEDMDEGNGVVFNIGEDDLNEFPELKGINKIILEQDDNGFVWITAA
jgi:hypothetical protein